MKRAPAPVQASTVTTFEPAPVTPLSGATDAALLALLDARLGELDTMRVKTHAAYLAARSRSNTPGWVCDDWLVIDGRWDETIRAVKAGHNAAEASNYNSAAHQAARVGQARALLAAAEWFDSYQPPKAMKPILNHNQVFAHRAASGGEHWLETRERLEREAGAAA